jgi:hypothetical protein
MASNGGGPSQLQSARPMGRVAELGSPILGRILAAIEAEATVSLPKDDIQILIDEGFIIATNQTPSEPVLSLAGI